jgi:hypothetical protein
VQASAQCQMQGKEETCAQGRQGGDAYAPLDLAPGKCRPKAAAY